MQVGILEGLATAELFTISVSKSVVSKFRLELYVNFLEAPFWIYDFFLGLVIDVVTVLGNDLTRWIFTRYLRWVSLSLTRLNPAPQEPEISNSR